MPVITIDTEIYNDIEICFDLSRSIDLHQISTSKTNEIAIDGRTSGLISLGETVTWQATHFGIRQKLKSIISAYDRPYHFRDEQVKGAFKNFTHDHYFEFRDNKTFVKDIFEFESPFGLIGKAFNSLILTKYMTDFLTKRNLVIKGFAESDRWKEILKQHNN